MKLILLWLSLVTVSYNISGQQVLTVKKGRINTTTGQLIKFNNLKETGDEFLFNKPSVTGDYKLQSDEVLKIDQKTGDHALEFGLIMGASGLLGGFIGYKISESTLESGYSIDRQATTRNIMILTGISALAGVIWGANVPKYSTVYENPKYSSIFPKNIKLIMSMGETRQLGIKYTF